MANNSANIKVTATLLPDQIAKTISNVTVNYQPANSTEGWYYQLSKIDATSRDLIAATSFLQKGSTAASSAVATGASIDSIAPADDKVKFLFIKNMAAEFDGTVNTTDSIYLVVDASAAAHNSAVAIEIGPNECWFGKMNTSIQSVHVICGQKAGAGTSSKTLQAQVYAIIDDI